MKQTINLRTLEKWLNKQLRLSSVHQKEWNDGYDAALSDLQIQIDMWRERNV